MLLGKLYFRFTALRVLALKNGLKPTNGLELWLSLSIFFRFLARHASLEEDRLYGAVLKFNECDIGVLIVLWKTEEAFSIVFPAVETVGSSVY